jgi:outer membrane cobalamin receptor
MFIRDLSSASRHLRLSPGILVVFMVSALTPPELHAQAAPPVAEPVDTIVVTGSRIKRPDLSAVSPVTVVGSDDVRDSGNVTVENTLNELPQIAAGVNSQTNANAGGGSGVLSANLRALGATRTLVLVNGRRYISANQDGIVDLASVPDMLIDRVEVMTGIRRLRIRRDRGRSEFHPAQGHQRHRSIVLSWADRRV